MGIGTPQHLGTTSTAAGDSTLEITTIADVAVGDLIYVGAMNNEGLGITSVADNASGGSNTYNATSAFWLSNGGSIGARCFYSIAARALPSGSTITVTYTTADAIRRIATAAYVSGILSASPLDSSVQTKATNQAPTATSATLAQADEVLFGFVVAENMGAAGYTEPTSPVFTRIQTTQPSDLADLSYRVVSATTAVTYAGTITGGTNKHWGMSLDTFKGAPATARGNFLTTGVG